MNSSLKDLNKVSTASLLVALGIIYGDIGTSPLYALRAVAGDRPVTEALVYGGVSCIFWTLVLQTTVKYVWLTLQADNQGEGGIFSLYALVRRYGRKLVIPTILGATTLLADGIITPPISVASAIEGLGMVKGLEQVIVPGNGIAVGLVIVILSALFVFQRFGTQLVGRTFGPVMLVWFSLLLAVGVYNIASNPGVLRALNPRYGYELLTQYPKGFWLLGSVFLCTTGAEALYSDLGHCGLRNIRFTWAFVKVSLVANYAGQAAWLMQHAQGSTIADNPFFAMMPGWLLLPGIIVATAATIIASQALISGSFTLINEGINLNFWPRVTVRQPTDVKGQIYIPSINTLLWAGCVLMILYFRSSAHMEAAYGFSITVTMMMTTILLAVYLRCKRRWNIAALVPLVALFATVETAFFIANVAKIKERWMFLFFELFIFLVMYVWYYARKANNVHVRFTDIGKYVPLIGTLSRDSNVPLFATHLVYLTKANSRHQLEEKIIRSILSRRPKRAQLYWFLHINRTEEPYTQTYDVSVLAEERIIKVNIHLGFRVQARTELYFKRILKELTDSGELKLLPDHEVTHKYHEGADFRFVLIEKFLSAENDLKFRDSMLLNAYFLLKRIGQSDEKAFGLDKSDVEIEHVPLVYQPVPDTQLARIPDNGLKLHYHSH